VSFELNKIYVGDCLEIMRSWPDAFVQTVVTSPPYWGLRDYGVPGQLGLEPTPVEYVSKMVNVFREVRRILRDDGTLWLNLGDCYTSGGSSTHGTRKGYKQESNAGSIQMQYARPNLPAGLKPKDLVGIPWRVAFALQSDGWYLRSDIIWAKTNGMPESVTDRPTKAHEYLFLLSKSERYFYDADAIKEPGICTKLPGPNMTDTLLTYGSQNGSFHEDGRRSDKQRGHSRRHAGFNDRSNQMEREEQCFGMRNKRSVWIVPTVSFSTAHFATFPAELIRPCIVAGSRTKDIVFDPFMGAGTTALVAAQYGRQFLGTELNPAYLEIAQRRIVTELAQLKMAI